MRCNLSGKITMHFDYKQSCFSGQRMWGFLLFFSFCLLRASCAFAQNTVILKGTIKNEKSNEVVPFATVYCDDLRLGLAADLQGFFYFRNFKLGKHRFLISSVGYEELDTVFMVSKETELRFFLKEKRLTLDEVVVTAQSSKELPTSSVIKQNALRHLQPNSFADILELIPGGIAYERGMTTMNLIALRQPLEAASLSNGNEEQNTSLGTAFIVDGIPLSNDAQLQNVTGAPKHPNTNLDYILYRNTTGKGIDMRMISTDDIDKVEIVRGIPSVKYGDLTSGLVNIKRSYASKPLRIRMKATPSMKLAAVGKGFVIGKHTLNVNIDYVDYLSDPRNEKVNYSRMTASLRYANAKSISATPLFFNASLDYTGSFDKSKRDAENDTENESYRNKYNKIRFASKLFWQKEEHFFDELELSLSASYTSNKKIINRIATGRLSPILSATEEGEYYGEFLPASYPAHLEIDGKPLHLFGKLHSQFHWDMNAIRNKMFLGAEWRFNKNFGEGEVFDLRRPLFEGNGRPRRSKDIPAMQNLSLYAEDNTTINIGKSKLNAQVGVRATSLLGMDKKYSNLQSKFYFDPRANLSFEFPQFDLWKHPVTFALHAGFGWHTKMPTLSHLYPNKHYFDIVQLNYYSQNESLRQMQYKVRIIDPTNFELKPNRNEKWELGFTTKIGKAFFELNYYKEKMEEGFRRLSNYDFMNYKLYDIESGPKPSELTGPPTVDMFEYKAYKSFLLYSQYTNGAVEEKTGVEYSLNLGNIPEIKSDVGINGAWMKMKYGQSLPRYRSSSTVIGGEGYPYLGYYEWDDSKEFQQFNTNIRFDTKIDRLGLIFSSTFQTIWYTLWKYVPHNGMPTYYFDKDNNRYSYTEKDTTDPVLRFLYDKPDPNQFEAWREPVQIDYNLKVTKRITKNIDMGFYVNRILHYYADFHRPDGLVVKRDSSPYFGMELNIKL